MNAKFIDRMLSTKAGVDIAVHVSDGIGCGTHDITDGLRLSFEFGTGGLFAPDEEDVRDLEEQGFTDEEVKAIASCGSPMLRDVFCESFSTSIANLSPGCHGIVNSITLVGKGSGLCRTYNLHYSLMREGEENEQDF